MSPKYIAFQFPIEVSKIQSAWKATIYEEAAIAEYLWGSFGAEPCPQYQTWGINWIVGANRTPEAARRLRGQVGKKARLVIDSICKLAQIDREAVEKGVVLYGWG